MLFLTDILPTGYTGIDWSGIKGGETVAVFGCGPVGLMAMKSAWLRGAKRVIGLDIQQYRLDMAKKAANAETILVSDDGKDAIQMIRDMSDGRGADVVIDAVGMEADRDFLDRVKSVIRIGKGNDQCSAYVSVGST